MPVQHGNTSLNGRSSDVERDKKQLEIFFNIGTDGPRSFIRVANCTKWVKNLFNPDNHDDCVHIVRFTSFNPGPD